MGDVYRDSLGNSIADYRKMFQPRWKVWVRWGVLAVAAAAVAGLVWTWMPK